MADEITYDVSLDDSDQVLELIQSTGDGLSVRDNGEWRLLPPDDESPTVWDREWVDVSPEFIPVYDGMRAKDNDITRADTDGYTVPEQ